MTDRKSGKSKKKHKEQAEKINLREAAEVLKAAEKKVSPRRAVKTLENETSEVTYAPEPMPEPMPEPAPMEVLEPEPVEQPAPEPRPAARALVTTPKTEGDDAAETMQQSLNAAQKGASAVNAKLIDMAQETMNSGLEHARDLAGATNPMQIFKLQMSYWHETMESFTAQAQELRTLSAELVANSSEPIRAHLRRAQAAKR
jgi:hypothetical protein